MKAVAKKPTKADKVALAKKAIEKGKASRSLPAAATLTLSADAHTEEAPAERPASGPQTATGTGKPELIPFADLVPGHNAREKFEQGPIRELAEAIFAQGLKQRLIVYPHAKQKGKFAIHGGNRRYLAIKLLLSEKRWSGAVPCEVQYEATESKREIVGLMENLQRVDLNPMEKAKGVKHAIDTGGYVAWDPKNPARSMGHLLGFESKSTIYALINLANLCPIAAQAAAAWPGENSISPSVADKLARIRDPKQQGDAAKRAISQHLTDDTATEVIEREYQRQLKGAQFDPTDAALVPFDKEQGCGGACATCPKRSGNQVEMFGEFEAKGRGDMCLLPACYRLKIAAAYKLAAAAVVAKGGEAKDLKYAQQHYISGHGHAGGGYSTLKERAYGIGDGKKTYGQLGKEGLESGELKLVLIPWRDEQAMGGWYECVHERAFNVWWKKHAPAREKEEDEDEKPEKFNAQSWQVKQELERRHATAVYTRVCEGLPEANLGNMIRVAAAGALEEWYGTNADMLKVAEVPWTPKTGDDDDDETAKGAVIKALPTMEVDVVLRLFAWLVIDGSNNEKTTELLHRAVGQDMKEVQAECSKALPEAAVVAREMNAEQAEKKKWPGFVKRARALYDELAKKGMTHCFTNMAVETELKVTYDQGVRLCHAVKEALKAEEPPPIDSTVLHEGRKWQEEARVAGKLSHFLNARKTAKRLGINQEVATRLIAQLEAERGVKI